MRRFLSTAMAMCLAASVANARDAAIENFELLDQAGQAQELYYFGDVEYVVLVSFSNACPELERALPQVSKLAAKYGGGKARFFLINSEPGSERESVKATADRLGLTVPVLMDDAQLIGEALGITHAAEAMLVRTNGWKLVWQGSVSGIDKSLKRVLAGKKAPRSKQVSNSCEIAFPERDRREQHASISYEHTIAPMLIDKCVTCHREGGIGPWAMTNHAMIKGFAPMIREVVRTQRMPPWHADPAHGEFSNDRSLSRSEKQTLVHWIEAGAPRGQGADPLAEYDVEWPEWSLGEPDLVIEIPPYEVPASGVVEYQYPRVRNPLDKDVWVRAAEILPGDRRALHHVITRFLVPDAESRSGFARGGGLGGYVPGAVAREFADGTGTLLPAGAVVRFQMHYTPYGKATRDVSRLGLYFHDEPPTHQRSGVVLMNTNIRIPPHAKAHTESQSRVLDRPVLLYSLLPHSHYRGIASDFVAHYPDGSSEVLLSVPNYDFNWQTSYHLKNPKVLPAGTRLVHHTTWDNSAQNPANPDPEREVPWGQQSWDEMLFGTASFRYLEERSSDDSSGADQFAPGR